jgi:protein phosphatase
MDFYIEAACGSSVGKVRHNNEDNFLFDGNCLPQNNRGQMPPLNLYGSFEGNVCMAVFDGMGGMDYGEVASATAAEHIKQLTQNSYFLPEDLEDACLGANRAVWDAQTALGTHNVGTTLAMLCFHNDQVHAVNVGDSRIFGLRDNRLIQISVDHTDEAYMKEKGIVGRKPKLTQYLGMDPGQVRLEPHLTKGLVQAGDVYLLCSDGLTDMLDAETICQLLAVSGTASACVENLIGAALEKGGHDNVTAIVCRILEQTNAGRKEYEPNTSESPVARLGDLGLSWGRKLWSSIQDTAKHIRHH